MLGIRHGYTQKLAGGCLHSLCIEMLGRAAGRETGKQVGRDGDKQTGEVRREGLLAVPAHWTHTSP